MNCGKLMLCQWYPVCRCNAAGCVAPPETDIQCDLHFSAAEASGSCTGTMGNARFFRAE